ncbi:MAG: aminotransferase [Halanaerobium sp. 4-GBenrich]|jgi:aminotransferase|uniref:Aminotransferase n=1 Tax=Halanaerobium congolense TaxID=54121 RepID=A0A1G6NTT1_9FIRM|nr:aminotransferase class I/II-fold pyridoxal phosphate-dependent enzyme [Halanaerobium congolense]KXS48869.1 MAG: aminotransferase [Halanaerobium sp. T82-1]ODS49992.1 MAG: aminotransferase [Halanaerobium sp. 4-GBenrich]PUU91596.1 MAG: aminotransferase [Halanaerobium sp.]PTX17827.1 aminotransferase [Halanaerobium congolense]PXV63509.1 aminotransferase [Halanaerobium congolense]
MPELNKKIDKFSDSVIRRMTRIANKYDAVNLSQGFPDFDPPAELKEALKDVAGGSIHQYAVTWGAANFREALAKKQSDFMGIDIDPEKEIVVTCGSTEAMMAAMMTVCSPGDKVVVFSPFYENYAADAILSGADPIYVNLNPPEFDFDPEELEEALQQGVKALILCNPSNPSGKVFSRSELETIAELVDKYDVFVITDEVYEHIVYPPNEHLYFASLPGMFERTISCSSLSKTYSITGWRLGYLIAPEKIIDGARQIHDFLTVGAAAPLQEAAVTALNFDKKYYQELEKKYGKKRKLFLRGLDQIGLNYTKPQGAYYVMVDISEFNFKDDLEFCKWMIKEVGVAAVPGSSFFKGNIKHLVRFHFAKKDETLKKALERLEKLPKKAKKRNN